MTNRMGSLLDPKRPFSSRGADPRPNSDTKPRSVRRALNAQTVPAGCALPTQYPIIAASLGSSCLIQCWIFSTGTSCLMEAAARLSGVATIPNRMRAFRSEFRRRCVGLQPHSVLFFRPRSDSGISLPGDGDVERPEPARFLPLDFIAAHMFLFCLSTFFWLSKRITEFFYDSFKQSHQIFSPCSQSHTTRLALARSLRNLRL